MKNIRTKFAAVAIAAAALVAMPVAASAATNDYSPAVPPAEVIAVTPGEPAPVTFTGFEPGETVTFTLTGEGVGPDNLALVKAAPTSTSVQKTATAAGAATATVTLPTNATGSYQLVSDSPSTAPQAITITIAGAGGALPATGIDAASMTGVWIGGGALLAAGIAVTSVAMIRRRQAEQA